jgi:predicted DNA-binding transcriptional regulator YafY
VKLERAIRRRRVIRCRYRMKKERYEITLKPLKIVNFKGYWYLLAMDARNDEIKKYLLRKISNIKTEEESFTPPENLDEALSRALAVWFEPGAEPFEVRLFVDDYAAKYFRTKPIAPTQTILGEDSDGSIELSVTITHAMELIPLIKQWMPHIRVLEPEWLEEKIRQDVKAWLEG